MAIDIGAHKGIWTQAMMMSFDHVYSFEPIESNFDVLRQINPDSYQVALGDETMCCSFAPGPDNTGQYHIDSLEGAYFMRPLDHWHFSNVDFIKIDVEGYEHYVIEGAIETIGKSHPAILLEDNGLSERYAITSEDINKLMESLGYEKRFSFQQDHLWLHE